MGNKGEIVEILISVSNSYSNDFATFTSALHSTVRDELWKSRYSKALGGVVTFSTFKEFVETRQPEGMGTTMEHIEGMLEANLKTDKITPELERFTIETIANLSLIKAGERPTRGGNGSNQHKKEKANTSNGLISKKTQAGGNSKDVIFARLLRDSKAGNKEAKEIMEKVMRKEISHNKASVLMGYSKPQFTCLMDIDSVVSQIKNKFNRKDIKKIIELLGE